MVKNGTRVEKIVSNMLLQGDAQECFRNWKKALVAYQKASKPDSKTKPAKLDSLRTDFEKWSWEFVRLTDSKPSVRDAMISGIVKPGSLTAIEPIRLRMGLDGSTFSLTEYENEAGLQALHPPLHIVVETNTTVAEIKQFLAANKKQIDALLNTRKVGTLSPLRVERDKLIKKYAKLGMAADEIAVEIDSEQKFKPLHGEDGITVAAVEKVIQRKAKHDKQK